MEEAQVENTMGHRKMGDGVMMPGVVVTCSRCGHATESCGTGDSSIRRCLALMREECPEGKRTTTWRSERGSIPARP